MVAAATELIKRKKLGKSRKEEQVRNLQAELQTLVDLIQHDANEIAILESEVAQTLSEVEVAEHARKWRIPSQPSEKAETYVKELADFSGDSTQDYEASYCADEDDSSLSVEELEEDLSDGVESEYIEVSSDSSDNSNEEG